MSFFNRKKKQEQASKQLSKTAISSIISREMHVDGEIRFKGKARIDGSVEGDIQGEYLILSKTGMVKGNVKLDVLICHGTVEGDIEARQVTAHPTASTKGILKAENLVVELGATIEGEIQAFSEKENDTKKSEVTSMIKNRDINKNGADKKEK